MSNIAETLTASGFKKFCVTGRFVRLMNATGSVEIVYFLNGSEIARTGSVQAGYAEEFDEVFDSFIIYDKSAAPNTVEILYRMTSRARYDRAAGNVSIIGGTVTNVAKQAAPDTKVWTNSYASNVSLGANAAQQIVAPAANVNGIEIVRATYHCATGGGFAAFVAKSGAAPASVVDGNVLDAIYGQYMKIEEPLFVPAGQGIYAINGAAEGVVMRSMLYRIL